MTLTPDTMQALVQLSKTMPNSDQFLQRIVHGLAAEMRDEKSVLAVMITTPTGDSGDFRIIVEKLVAGKTHHPVQITERADPSMLGGVILTFGDEQVDMSVRASLSQAAHAIAGQHFSPIRS